MKILIVQSHLGGGGAERVGVLLANGFVSHGHQVNIATDLTVSPNYNPSANVKLFNIITHHGNVILKWLYAIKELRALLKKEHPDVIIGIMQLCSLVTYIASYRLHIPIVMTEHYAFERPGNGLTRLETFSKYYINRLYSLVTVLTNVDKLLIGNRLRRVEVVNNPLTFSPAKYVPSKHNIILAAGRLDGWYVKGFDVLIKSFAKLLNGSKVAGPRSMFKSNDIAFKIREERWKLQIAGTGSEESLNYLKQLCKENGVEDSVEFLGFRKDVEKLYQEASVFVLSSRYEGFGLVLIEAMSQGCACVACDYKGRQREIMNPTPTLPEGEGAFEACETGILCEPDDVDALAAGIRKMIEDDAYRESVRKNAIERSKYYSIENTVDRWELVLNKVVKR